MENGHYGFHQKRMWRIDFSLCIPIAEKNTNEMGCITSKKIAVDLQKCLSIAVKEKQQRSPDLFSHQKGMQSGVFKTLFE